MLVGLFCLVTKGQRVAVSYKKPETKKCVGCCDQREASSQLRMSKDGVLTPRATPDSSTRPALGPAGGSTWRPRDGPRLPGFTSLLRPDPVLGLSRVPLYYPAPPTSHTIHQPSANPSEGPAGEREQHNEQPFCSLPRPPPATHTRLSSSFSWF